MSSLILTSHRTRIRGKVCLSLELACTVPSIFTLSPRISSSIKLVIHWCFWSQVLNWCLEWILVLNLSSSMSRIWIHLRPALRMIWENTRLLFMRLLYYLRVGKYNENWSYLFLTQKNYHSISKSQTPSYDNWYCKNLCWNHIPNGKLRAIKLMETW